MTKLEFINKIFFQWFFVRLTKHMKKDDCGNYTIIEKYSIQGVIVPMTGWGSDYKFISDGFVDLTPLFFILIKIHLYGLFVFTCVPDVIDTYGKIFLCGFLIALLNEIHGQLKSINESTKFLK